MPSIFARLHRRYGHRMNGHEREGLIAAKLESVPELPRVSEHVMAALAMQSKPRPKVAIVGGGFAGLMAGYLLIADCEVTIFEARRRVGGRVWTKTKSSGLVEAGGELIGYNHPTWLKLAGEFELGFSVNTSDESFGALKLEMPFYIDGKRRSHQEMKTVYDEMDAAFRQLAEKAVHGEKVDPDKPWTASRATYLDEMKTSEWVSGLNCSDLTRAAIEEQFTNDAGVPTDKQSFLANLAVVAGGKLGHKIDAFFTQSETLRCSEGNGALADRLADKIAEAGGNIRRCSPVSAIDIAKEGVTLKYRSGSLSDHVAHEPDHPHQGCVFSDDKTQDFHADYVVLAIPPSLWPTAEHPQIKITPELPSDHYVSMGKAVKYLSPLKRRFWIHQKLAPSSTSSRFGVTWEGTDNQIAPPGRDVELSLFAGGPVAQEALDRWKPGDKAAVVQFYQQRIGEVYPDYAANVSGEPDFMAWPEDPWTRAGYSFPAPGEVTRAGPRLHAPFEKRMYFAGEHTCFAYIGYMEGALQSGQRVADDIRAAIRIAPVR
jgi:monoamine oxidase